MLSFFFHQISTVTTQDNAPPKSNPTLNSQWETYTWFHINLLDFVQTLHSFNWFFFFPKMNKLYTTRCKHGKLDNSWSLPMLMWFKTIHKLWILWKKNHRYSKKHIDLQSQAIYDDNNNCKKSLHIWEDNESGVQVGDIEQVTV